MSDQAVDDFLRRQAFVNVDHDGRVADTQRRTGVCLFIRVPGAKFVEVSGKFGVWQIPQEALSMTPPRLGRKKGVAKKSKKGAK